jgi:hypothetical protein
VMTGNKAVHATFGLLLTDQSAPPPGPAQWTTVLDAPGGTGNLTVDGAATAGIGRAPATIAMNEAAGGTRVQGVLATGGGPGTWRFERHATGGPPVRLKALEGQVTLVTPDAIVFRLRGQPGERVAFVIVPVP